MIKMIESTPSFGRLLLVVLFATTCSSFMSLVVMPLLLMSMHLLLLAMPFATAKLVGCHICYTLSSSVQRCRLRSRCLPRTVLQHPLEGKLCLESQSWRRVSCFVSSLCTACAMVHACSSSISVQEECLQYVGTVVTYCC